MAQELFPFNRILIVDDNSFFREGMRGYLERKGFETLEANDGASAIRLAHANKIDAAIVDIVLSTHPQSRPEISRNEGIKLARELKLTFPSMGVLIFSAYKDRGNEVLDLAADGIRGLAYLVKGTHPLKVLNALLETCKGQVVLDSQIQNNADTLGHELWKKLTPDELPWIRQAVNLFPTLTPREREIAWLLADSRTIQGIADALSISTKTVEKHTNHIYSKLYLKKVDRFDPPMRKALLLAKACWLIDLEGNTR